jgi:N-methylhydantoinase A
LHRVSVDVGGTFTDLVAFDEETGDVLNIKTPSSPMNPERGVVKAFREYLEDHEASDVMMVGHATTIATNTLLGQINLELPLTALVTTKGFRDVIEIGRQRRAEVYNLFFERPPMLVQRRHRYELEERVDHDGDVITPIDEEELNKIIGKLRREGVQSIVVGLLNSYANTVHEEKVSEALKASLNKVYVTASHTVTNEYREYERFSTAVVNAALMPVMHTYITRLEGDLKRLGLKAPLYVMQSNGGMAKSNVISRKPVTVVESGPAAGVIAAAWLGEQTGIRNIISFDMGGTTAKAGTIRGRVPEVVPEYEVAGTIHMGRLVKGSGYPVRFPFIDLAECSAGGGTVARAVNGTLQVGPVSAGAIPGPACYGKGGEDATITDANLLLGRLNPGSLLGGEMKIHSRLAEKAFTGLASDLGVSPEEAAVSVVRIANSMMSKILRIVSVERGYDPRGFTLVAFGGAGPMHACALAEELGIGHVIVPPSPGMFSALGLLTADLFHDYSRPVIRDAAEADPAVLERLYGEMEVDGASTLSQEGIPERRRSYRRTLDIRYRGQGFELGVDTRKPVTHSSIAESVKAFHVKHKEVYGYSAEEEPTEIVNVKLRVVGLLEKPKLRRRRRKRSSPSPDHRRVYYESLGDWVGTEVHQRAAMNGLRDGPAVIEQYDATTVVYPGWSYTPDDYGNLILRRLTS